MDARFNGIDIFGSPTRVDGPVGKFRRQDETLPGVSGFRVYRLGKGATTWVIRGRLSDFSLDSIKNKIWRGIGYMDGNLYTFRDSDGSTYDNCVLDDFRAIGEFEGCIFSNGINGVTVEVQATVQWASPTD